MSPNSRPSMRPRPHGTRSESSNHGSEFPSAFVWKLSAVEGTRDSFFQGGAVDTVSPRSRRLGGRRVVAVLETAAVALLGCATRRRLRVKISRSGPIWASGCPMLSGMRNSPVGHIAMLLMSLGCATIRDQKVRQGPCLEVYVPTAQRAGRPPRSCPEPHPENASSRRQATRLKATRRHRTDPAAAEGTI